MCESRNGNQLRVLVCFIHSVQRVLNHTFFSKHMSELSSLLSLVQRANLSDISSLDQLSDALRDVSKQPRLHTLFTILSVTLLA